MKVNAYISAAAIGCQNKITHANYCKRDNTNSIPKNQFIISFEGVAGKNTSQTVSIAPEYQGILNSIYKLGGLGNVAGEASVAFTKEGNMDFRTIVPYYAPDNINGEVKVRTPKINNGKQVYWTVPTGIASKESPEKNIYQKIAAYDFKSVPTDYVLKKDENFVIHEDVQSGKEWQTGYKVLEDTGINGFVESVKDDLSGIEKTPYKVFSIKETLEGNPAKPPVYVIHLPQLAKCQKAYGGVAYAGNSFYDAYYGLFSRAAVDALPKLNDKKFGNFNPANIWLHDRQAFPSLIEIAERSSKGNNYWKGIRAHSSYHNPGRNYQGYYANPVDFMRIVGNSDDLEQLQKNPSNYKFVQKMIEKIETTRKTGKMFDPEDILTKDEIRRLNEIFKPLYGNFLDETGKYNMCAIPVAARQKNPFNFSIGTVSKTFGNEMMNHNTKEIAYGLTSSFASVPMVNIVNGSSAQSMRLDEIGNFGSNNGFTDEIKKGFTPLTDDIKASATKLFEAKQSNKKWLIDTIAQSSKKGKRELGKLFFSEKAIKDGATVLGEFSEYKEGDVLFVSWGRPESQKGFPTTLQGFFTYLKNPKVSPENKLHTKFLISAGPWNKNSADWTKIQKLVSDIQLLDNGKYKGNICYLNGFFTSRIVACADYSNITSRYEPCGITPLESFAGGTPVISNNTGGSPDFIVPYTGSEKITKETGFLTKNAYLVNPEVIGANPNLKMDALDDARQLVLGKENAQCIEKAVDLITTRPNGYKQMMMNAMKSKIDWFENNSFNGGLSAIDMYKKYAWQINENNKELPGLTRNMENLVNLKDEVSVYSNSKNIFSSITNTLSTTKSKHIAIATGACAVFIGIYSALIKTKKNNQAKEEALKKAGSKLNIMSLNNFATSNNEN